MIKKIKYLVFIIIFSLFSNCSFDKKTGIWSGSEDEKKKVIELERQQKRIIEVIKVYSSDDSNFSEISAVKNVRLSEPKKNSSWKTSGSNNQNFSGNIYLTGVNNIFLKKKIGKNKFFLSKVMTSPIIYDGIIFFSDDTGTIYSIDKKGKLKWKKNIYR